MKKILIKSAAVALFLSLCITGCAGTPDKLPSELVSVDFGGSQSAEISVPQDSTTNDSTAAEPEDKAAKPRKQLELLGNGNVICNINGNVDYDGGALELSCTVKYDCSTKETPESMSTGCLIAINGVLQKFSCEDQKDTYMYIETFSPEDDISTDSQYRAQKQFTLSFEPQINEEDKDLTKLQLTVITVDNPLFRLKPEWPFAYLVHRTATSHVLTMTLNSPITNYTENNISGDGFTELELTKEVAKEYSTMVNVDSRNLSGNTAPFVNVDADGYSSFCFDENGKLNLGFITSVCDDMAQGRYLISMFVNGSPHPFPDGSMYKSVDMVPGKLYVYEAEDFSGILSECDSIVFLPVACLRDDGKRIMTETVMAHAILPKDKEGVGTPEH